jgi:hypothetical protein
MIDTDNLRNDLAFDISYGFNIKDKKLLDTVMDRVMETLEAWEMRKNKKK